MINTTQSTKKNNFIENIKVEGMEIANLKDGQTKDELLTKKFTRNQNNPRHIIVDTFVKAI